MLTRAQGGVAATVVAVFTVILIVLDGSDRGFRAWWSGHALTTDVVAGLLVLLITLLVVDQVVRRRQVTDRSRAVGAQVAMVMAQAMRATDAVSSAPSGSDGGGTASDEVRTYTMMLLIVAPLLIEDPVSRSFLEQAQRLAGEMLRAQRALANASDRATISSARLHDAVAGLRAASSPLLHVLDLDAFFAADAEANAP